MNFCTFSLCEVEQSTPTPSHPEALVAVPNTLALEEVSAIHVKPVFSVRLAYNVHVLGLLTFYPR